MVLWWTHLILVSALFERDQPSFYRFSYHLLFNKSFSQCRASCIIESLKTRAWAPYAAYTAASGGKTARKQKSIRNMARQGHRASEQGPARVPQTGPLPKTPHWWEQSMRFDFIEPHKAPQPTDYTACPGLLIPELQLFRDSFLSHSIKIKDEVLSSHLHHNVNASS